MTRYGELLYSFVIGEEFRRGDVILDSQLPEDLGDFILRTLTSRADAYRSIESIYADVMAYHKIVNAESATLLTWDDLNLEEVKTDWRRRWLPPQLYRAFERWHQFGLAHPRFIRRLELGVLAAFLVWLGVTWFQNRPVRLAHIQGPAVFVAESNGVVELVDVNNQLTAGWIEFDGTAEAMIYSPTLRRVCFSMPATHSMASLDLTDNELVRTSNLAQAPQRLYLMAGQTIAMGLLPDGQIQAFEIANLRSGHPASLPQKPLDFIVIARLNSIVYLDETGEGLIRYSPNVKRVMASRKLHARAREIRFDRRDMLIWLLPEEGGEISALDAETLRPVHMFTLPERVVDIAFGSDVFLLLATSGNVAQVHRPKYTLDAALLPGLQGSRRILQPAANELWFLGNASELEVHTLDGSIEPRRVLLRSSPLDFILSSGS